MKLDSKMTVSELLKIHPSAMDVFIKRKMLCVGCPTEAFHTLEEVAGMYALAIEQFLRELREAVNSPRES